MKISILQKLSKPLIKTHILQEANINSSRLTELLNELIEANLIVKRKGNKRIKFLKYNGKIVYGRTSKGYNLLCKYEKIIETLNNNHNFL